MSEQTRATSHGPETGDILPQKIDEDSLAVFLSRQLAAICPGKAEYARRWLIERIAKRAIEILEDDGTSDDDERT